MWYDQMCFVCLLIYFFIQMTTDLRIKVPVLTGESFEMKKRIKIVSAINTIIIPHMCCQTIKLNEYYVRKYNVERQRRDTRR